MPPLIAILLLSAGTIAYEILLMRLFSIIQWHHFSYMIISLALLGYGASGTFIALTRRWLLKRFRVVFATAATLFGITTVASYAAAQKLPFNPLEVVWDAHQQLYLLCLYLLLAIPFFCAATCIGLTFSRFGERIDVIYRCDLLGAGIGSFSILVAMFALPPASCLKILSAFGLIAAGFAFIDRASGRWPAFVLFAVGLLLPSLWPHTLLKLRLSPYKGLSQTLQIPGTRIIEERSSPLGSLAVVESRKIPFRHAPGLSLQAIHDIPHQLAIFQDGDSMTAVTRYDKDRASLAYLDFQSSALPYHLLDRPQVLVLGAGGGSNVLLAHHHRARSIDAVELNPQMVDLVQRTYADFAGYIYDLPEVRVHVAEARGFVASNPKQYHLITLSLLDSFAASAAGLYALTESTLYTVEAFETFLNRLHPDGMLAITRWLKLPPRDSLKLFATAVTALERLGFHDPKRRIALIRSWNTSTLLVKKGPFSLTEINRIKNFSNSRGFDLAYHPGIASEQVNRHNKLQRPYLYEGAKALLGPERKIFIRDYKFHIAPATDDRPYFFHFFKWGILPELLSLWGSGGALLIEWGYVVLFVTLVLAVLASIVLILVPLKALVRHESSPAGKHVFGWTVFYFFALGLGFLFIEIAFIQRFTLFLSHPLYSVAVVLCAFLVFAGLGSGYSGKITKLWQLSSNVDRVSSPILLAVAGIISIACLYLILLPNLFEWLSPLPQMIKVLVSVTLIAPLAFCMGMPFPLGLKRLSQHAPGLVPWAWGINGCASVLSAVLATLLAIHFGFTAVVVFALLMYGLAAIVFTRAKWVNAVG
ncbi:SAM-dependent methyltransferase [Nitrospinota bacterium]